MQRPLSLNHLIEMHLLMWSMVDLMSAHEDMWQASANADRMVLRIRAMAMIHMKCVKYVNRTLKLIRLILEIMA